MSGNIRKDALVTVIGLAAAVSLFVFGVLLPGRKTCKQLHQEIAAAEAAIRDVPLRVAELEHLRSELQDRRKFLTRSDHMIPQGGQLHDVIQQVAQLARETGLKGSRLEPVLSVQHRTYNSQAIRLELHGRFAGVTRFLAGLEQQSRIVNVQEVVIRGDDGDSEGDVSTEVLFAVYSQNDESEGFTDSPDSEAADI